MSNAPESGPETSSHPTVVPPEPIAIVGIGCRFPGGAETPEAFWKLLADGIDAIVDVPPGRWDMRRFYDPDPEMPGKMYVRQGGFLQQDLGSFDAAFFGISPREAAPIDPQQRLLLEVTWEALEDAGIPSDSLASSRTGVFIGGFCLDAKLLQLSEFNREIIGTHTATSATMALLSNRISYLFDFRGPSVTMDTACSSSLVALHFACNSLWGGECSVAIAGGVNVMLKPEYSIAMSKGRFLSPDSRCKAFDAGANGYARGEGAGILVLKPLSAACANRDLIYTLIQATAVNQDGLTNGMTVPNLESQIALVRAACARAGIDPRDVSYVEAHGTGTAVGDPIEARALGTVLGAGRPPSEPCLIGSVKTNIGHLEAGAGVAGVIKAALCLHREQVPPHLHLKSVNPDIPLDELRLRIPTQLEDLPRRVKPAVASVNSFGYGGTNAHVVLKRPPAAAKEVGTAHKSHDGKPLLLPLSTRNPKALFALAKRFTDSLDPKDRDAPDSIDVCRSAGLRRSHHPYRLAVQAEDREGLVKALNAYANGDQRAPGIITAPQKSDGDKLVLVFPGMGPQWWAMGRELMATEPVYREAIERCDSIFKQLAGWSLVEALSADEDASEMGQTRVGQPTNFALQVALTELWRWWGVRPDAVVGHSVGEVTAAYVSGALDLGDAVRVSYHRSRLQQTLTGQGTMLAVGLTADETQEMLRNHESRVSIAAINGPATVALAGDEPSLRDIAERLEKRGVFNRFLQVAVAYHSLQMDPLEKELRHSLAGLCPRVPGVPFYSTVTGARLQTSLHDAAYWWRNMREPVRFAETVDRLIADHHAIFLEVGPHPVLSSSIKECLRHRGYKGEVLLSLHRMKPERETMFRSLGALYTLGRKVDWQGLFGPGPFVRLPLYPWQREPHWHETEASRRLRLGSTHHPLLGQNRSLPVPCWETELNQQSFPYLPDHKVKGAVVFPGAGYVEIGLAIRQAVFRDHTCSVEEIEFHHPLVIAARETPRIDITFDPKARSFTIYRLTRNSEWKRCATGRLHSGVRRPAPISVNAVRARCDEELTGVDLYPLFETRGLRYGPAFQGIERLWRGPSEVLAQIVAPEGLSTDGYLLHPALLDATFQALVAAVTETTPSAVFLPVSIDQIRFFSSPGARFLSYGRVAEQTEDRITGDITLFDEKGNVAAEVLGLFCKAIVETGPAAGIRFKNWLYAYRWQQHDAEPDSSLPASWFLVEDEGGMGAALAEAFQSNGRACTVVPKNMTPTDLVALLTQVREGTRRNVVDLRGLDLKPKDHDPELVTASIHVTATLLETVQALRGGVTDRLFVLTQGAQSVLPNEDPAAVAHAPLWGLARTAMNEHPELHCTLVDLDGQRNDVQSLADILETAGNEEEIVLRDGRRYVNRLVRADTAHDKDEARQLRVSATEVVNFQLQVGTRGILDTLGFSETRRQKPRPGEVEIQVHAAALNFKDIMKAMGLLSDRVLDDTFLKRTLGMEGSGIVVAVGAGVTDFNVGDEVFAVAPDFFKAFVTIPIFYVVKKLDRLTLEQGAVLQVYLTAYHALIDVAQLGKGERVLIHAAAGGVGLAAIEVARWCGAEIFATAGCEEKRDFLRAMGIKYVSDSRSMAFVDDIMEWTNGQGVDVVLNSIAGETAGKSFSCLAPFGRFIEIGKRDIDENNSLSLRPFNQQLLYAAIDFDRMLEHRRDVCKRVLRNVVERLECGDFSPLPITTFPASQIPEAFRFMAEAKHIGKIVITMNDSGLMVAPLHQKTVPVRSDATYLVTGGLGGVGLEVARWLVEQGARHLVLVGRRGAATEEAQTVLAAMRREGAEVRALAADVTVETDLRRVLDEITVSMPVLRGIIHGAMALDDGLLAQLDAVRLRSVMAPKALGAWNLHRLTKDLRLDFMLFFSSVSSLIGNAGQGNYVAANTFLDALAHHRRARGLPGFSINWGVFNEVGVVARNPAMAEHLRRIGISGFSSRDATDALGRVLGQDIAQIGIIDIDWAQWARVNGAAARSPRFALLVAEDQGGEDGGEDAFRATLLAFEPSERHKLLTSLLAEEVAEVLRLPVGQLDVNESLGHMGVDSLMAVELVAAIHVEFGVELSAMEMMQGPTVHQMASLLLEKMALKGATQQGEDGPSSNGFTADATDHMSEEEVDAMLVEMLRQEDTP